MVIILRVQRPLRMFPRLLERTILNITFVFLFQVSGKHRDAISLSTRARCTRFDGDVYTNVPFIFFFRLSFQQRGINNARN